MKRKKKGAKNKKATTKKRMGEIDVTVVPCDGIPSKAVLQQLVRAGVADRCWICDPNEGKMTLVI